MQVTRKYVVVLAVLSLAYVVMFSATAFLSWVNFAKPGPRFTSYNGCELVDDLRASGIPTMRSHYEFEDRCE